MSVLLREFVLWFHQENQELSQMLPSEVAKTNKIAKTRILVEQVIQHSTFIDLLQMKF